MNFVIPMAGAGSRFVEAGYGLPKPLLEAHGKTLLEWSLDSLPLELSTKLIFVGLEGHRRDLEPLILGRYGDHAPKFIWLTEVTRGQAETVMKAEAELNPEDGLAIFNIDTAFRSGSLGDKLARTDHDGVLGSFYSTESRFSFARLDPEGVVTEVREKVPISSTALTGLYHFRHCADFIEAAGKMIAEARLEQGEFYVAPLYNQLIQQGKRFVVDDTDWLQILGTPEEYEEFLACSEVPGQ